MRQSLHPVKCIRLCGPAGMLTPSIDPPSGRSWKGLNNSCQMPLSIFISTSAPGFLWRPEPGRSRVLRAWRFTQTQPAVIALQPSPYWSNMRSTWRGQPSEPNGCKDPPNLSCCLIKCLECSATNHPNTTPAHPHPPPPDTNGIWCHVSQTEW